MMQAAEQRLFGGFFEDVDGCLHLMKTYSAFLSGNAVLQNLGVEFDGGVTKLDFFLQRSAVEEECWQAWDAYFRREGYSLRFNFDVKLVEREMVGYFARNMQLQNYILMVASMLIYLERGVCPR